MHFERATMNVLSLLASVAAAAGAEPTVPPDVILNGMEGYYERAFTSMMPYRAERRYFATHRLLTRPTYWIVDEEFRGFGHQTFHVREKCGPGAIHHLVFEPLLEVEQRSNQPSERRSFDITRRNYRFDFRGWDAQRNAWVFDVEPNTSNPYLFRGRIWVDAATYGVFRIEGEPGGDPSVMVRRTRFVHEFELVGGFWLPSRHRSEVHLVALGKASFGIDYYNYRMGVE